MIENTAYYRAIKLILPNKTLAFTDCPEDFKLDNTTYNSTDTILIENIELDATFNNLYTTFVLHSEDAKNEILHNKKQLKIEIYIVKIIDQNITLVRVRAGKVFEIIIDDNRLTIEIHNFIKTLKNNPNMIYTIGSRRLCCDKRCKINPEYEIIQNIKVMNTTNNCIDIDMTDAILPQRLSEIHKRKLNKLIKNWYVIKSDGKKYQKVVKFNCKQLKVADTIASSDLLPGDIINLQYIYESSIKKCKKASK